MANRWMQNWKIAGMLAWLLMLQANTMALAAQQETTATQVETFAVPEQAVSQPAGKPAPASPTTLPQAMPNQAGAPSNVLRIALLLPLRSESLGAAAEVIRSGFFAAWESEQDGILVNLVESGESAADVLDSYQLALAQHDVLVGPLPRAAVGTLIESGIVSKTTIALNHPEPRGAGEPPLRMPANMLLMGLSIEDEARQAATWAYTSMQAGSLLNKSGRAIVLSSNIAWQRRAAKAFAAQWQKLGGEPISQEIFSSSGFLSAAGLNLLKNRLPTDKPALAFIALDSEQTRQLRQIVGSDLPMFGTSQLNRHVMTDSEESDLVPFLEGVRLLELPWQLQRDHPAVMIYPRLIQSGEQRRSADLERLYALGIDAYRVARALALKPGQGFELDGVSGKLQVQFKKGVVNFERASQAAMYRQGHLQALQFGQYPQ